MEGRKRRLAQREGDAGQERLREEEQEEEEEEEERKRKKKCKEGRGSGARGQRWGDRGGESRQ